MKIPKKIFSLLWCCIIVNNAFSQTASYSLKSAWQFKNVSEKKWYSATVPGTIHTDLLAHKLIPDPFYRDNEMKVQWVSQNDWEYKTTFNIPAKVIAKSYIEIVFEGLDTYADVYLNRRLILKADNMFRTWRVNIKPYAKATSNQLQIRFRSAEKISDALAKQALPLKRPCENNRHYSRKAQYNFGWDWAPKLITCGIWRDINIESSIFPIKQNIRKVKPDERFTNNNVQLIQQPDSIGESFYFTVNGKPTFMKGANWIPADVFLPSITKDKYRNLLVAAKEAGMNMLRVWGGGIYEDDSFYDLCDSLGIYVWQDFMFAGAMYPADDVFLENVKQEVIDNIVRLRHHPCIVVWSGNNEIDEAWHHWGWQKEFKTSAADSVKLWDDYEKIFHHLLPQLVKEYDGRPYITTSPKYGFGDVVRSLSYGDSHYWGVWVMGEPIETYKKRVPRFMSEYGMQSMPNIETIEKYSLPADWDIHSATMQTHQKHSRGYQNMELYLKQNNLTYSNFKEYVTATQQVQSKALETAIDAHMQSNGRCMGTLFWQLNDCWPVASWSVIDYYGTKKSAYYKVKELYTKKATN